MRVCLDKSLFSSNKNLVISNDSYSWEDGSFDYDLFATVEKDSSLNKFLSLYGLSEISFLEDKYLKAIRTLGISNPAWKNLLPKAEYQNYKRNLQEKARH